MNRTLLLLKPALLLLVACGYRSEEADLVVHNAFIHPMDGSEEVHQAMAVRNGRILELGPEMQIRNRYAAKETYDAAGMHVYPGFIDGHCHFLGLGLNKQKADLSGAGSWEEVVERMARHAEVTPGEGWLLGRGWDQNLWMDGSYPDNTLLNARFPDRPVLVQRIDGHAAVVNQKALDEVGLHAGSVIAGGLLEVRNGGPTGLLLDNAVDVFQEVFDAADEGDRRRALQAAEADCIAAGITMVCDAGLDTTTIALMGRMHDAGELSIRVYAMLADRPENLAAFRGPLVTDRLIVRAVKVYGDGALGSRGALLRAPYSDVDTPWHGLQLASREHLDEVASWCAAHGFQMATHCIGDSAVHLLLSVYRPHLPPGNDLRWRIEHAQVVDPIDITAFRDQHVLPSVQPTHATSDAPWAGERLGPERMRTAYAYKDLLATNGMLALGTDFPVEAVDPMGTFRAAVLRENGAAFTGIGVQPEQALTRREALAGMTIQNAVATFTENDLGSLETGKRADMVVLDRDLEKVAPQQLWGVRVKATFIDGRRVH